MGKYSGVSSSMQMASSMASSSSIAEALSLGIPRQGTPNRRELSLLWAAVFSLFENSCTRCTLSLTGQSCPMHMDMELRRPRATRDPARQRLTAITRARSMSRLSARLDLSIAAAAVVTTYVRKQMRSTSHGHLSPAGDSRAAPVLLRLRPINSCRHHHLHLRHPRRRPRHRLRRRLHRHRRRHRRRRGRFHPSSCAEQP